MLPEPDLISEQSFWEDYCPIPAPAGTGDGGNLWDYEQAKDQPLERVWTVVDDGGETECYYAQPGFHIVNVIGYAVTEQPWTDVTKSAYWDFDDRDSYGFLCSDGEEVWEFGHDEDDARERAEALLDPGVTIVDRIDEE